MAAYYALPVAAPDLDGDRPSVGDNSDLDDDIRPSRSVREHLGMFRSEGLGTWIAADSRLGFAVQLSLVLTFLAVDSSRYIIDYWALFRRDPDDARVGAQILVLMQAGVSFLSAVLVSGGLEGLGGLRKAFLPKEICRCLPISIGFSLSTAALAHAFSMGLGSATALALGYLYMPLCALLSRWMFGRRYGWLEAHALVLLTLSSLTFAELRGRAINMQEGLNGATFLFISVVLSCSSSLLSEWVLKPKYCPENMQRFYLQKVRLEIWGVVVSAIVLMIMSPLSDSMFECLKRWDSRMTACLTVRVVQSWMAGVVAKHFSTVAKAVIQCLSLLIVFFLGDLVIFPPPGKEESVGSFQIEILAVVVALSTLLYQMGRERTAKKAQQQSRDARHALAFVAGPAAGLPVGVVDEGDGSYTLQAGTGEAAAANTFQRTSSDTTEYGSRARSLLEAAEGRATGQPRARNENSFVPDVQALAPQEFGDEREQMGDNEPILSFVQNSLYDRRWLARTRILNHTAFDWVLSTPGLLSQILCVATFIMFDATRTIVYDKTIHGTAVVQQSLVIMMSACSIPVGILAAGFCEGNKGVRLSMSPKMALKYLPVSACFSLGQTCQIFAYGVGVSGTENTVIGYAYIPLSTVLSRLIFRRVYEKLEWLALLLLVLSASAFVLMQDSGSSGSLTITGVILVLTSVVLSCLGSVLAEKIMKEDRGVPFYIQKVQLEIGGLITATLMLFISGYVSKRPNDAFWKKRDIGGGVMDSGIFVAWDAKMLLALAATLVQSWLGGLVAKRLSTVIRAVAQCLSLLLIFFVGDLVLNRKHFDWPQGTTALVVALTVQVFVLSAPTTRRNLSNGEESVEEETSAGGCEEPEAATPDIDIVRSSRPLKRSGGPTGSAGSQLSDGSAGITAAHMRSSTGGS